MAALPAGALPGTGPKPTVTDAQGGGLQSQTTGGNRGTAKRIENWPLVRLNEVMKNEKHDQPRSGRAHFHLATLRLQQLCLKTIPFADISRTVARIHFRIEQMEAVLAGCARKDFRAVQSRSVSSSWVRAMKSQNQSA